MPRERFKSKKNSPAGTSLEHHPSSPGAVREDRRTAQSVPSWETGILSRASHPEETFIVCNLDYNGLPDNTGIFLDRQSAEFYAESLLREYSLEDSEDPGVRLRCALELDHTPTQSALMASGIRHYVLEELGMDLSEASEMIHSYVEWQRETVLSAVVIKAGTGEGLGCYWVELCFNWDEGFKYEVARF